MHFHSASKFFTSLDIRYPEVLLVSLLLGFFFVHLGHAKTLVYVCNSVGSLHLLHWHCYKLNIKIKHFFANTRTNIIYKLLLIHKFYYYQKEFSKIQNAFSCHHRIERFCVSMCDFLSFWYFCYRFHGHDKSVLSKAKNVISHWNWTDP